MYEPTRREFLLTGLAVAASPSFAGSQAGDLATLTVKDIFNASISPYLFLWVFVGVGAAWRLASDHGTSVE